MLRRGYLRSKARGKDPVGNLYASEVRRQRKEHGYRAGAYDPHHLNGRHGNNLLFFVMIPRELHDHIHTHPRWARDHGWLAEINGSFSMNRPQVMWARQRQAELVQQLENKTP